MKSARDVDPNAGPVLLFDGVCNLCHGSVRFVIRRDPNRHFRFASLQSDIGVAIARDHGVEPDALESMLLLQEGRLLRKSTAALHVVRRLRYPWPILYLLIAIPRFIRDPVYDFIGRHRYRWFGKRELCLISDPQAADRFIH